MQARDWQVFDGEGRRKYVTDGEMGRFLTAVQALPPEGCAFCTLMVLTGCRISEALAVTRAQLGEGTITLRTLKRRKRVFRVLQVPPTLIEQLLALPVPPGAADRLWTAHRSTAFRWVKRAMRPELTNWPSDTHKRTKMERGGLAFELCRGERNVSPAAGMAEGGDGKRVISVRLPTLCKRQRPDPKSYTANPVGMRHCTKTFPVRFSAHAGRLHARVH